MAILRTDGGGEFGGRFARPRIYLFGEDTGVMAVCNLYGIRKEETVALESDMMGKAEAANRRALAGIRTLLYAANLPKEFWGFALKHWCTVDWYTVNRTKGKSPFMLRFDRPPVKEVRELRTFGARVSFYGKDKGDPKLDMPGHRGIFVGRNMMNGGYEIVDVEAVDSKLVTTVNVNKASFEEMLEHEAAGVTDADIRFTSGDV